MAPASEFRGEVVVPGAARLVRRDGELVDPVDIKGDTTGRGHNDPTVATVRSALAHGPQPRRRAPGGGKLPTCERVAPGGAERADGTEASRRAYEGSLLPSDAMTDVLVVAGARPNFMKVKPVIDAVEALGLAALLVHTGQHYDQQMSDVFFGELGLRPPDRWLGVGSGSHAAQTAAVMTAMEPLIDETSPRAVVVVGDVNSTMAAAIVAAKAGCIVVHVEAGLRSRDWAMPEEVNRVVTDRVSDLLLAPSHDAVENLRAEGYRREQIVLVGNVMVDTLLANLERALARPVITDLGLTPQGYVLVTLHRPANVDDAAVLADLLHVLSAVAADLPVLFPAHPRTLARLSNAPLDPRIQLVEPQGYLDFIALQAAAACVLTDSGGIQEETTVLGVPCLTLRENTERPITITEGTNRLVGRDPHAVLAAYRDVRASPPPARRPALWDGQAGARCAAAIQGVLDDPAWRRPTAG